MLQSVPRSAERDYREEHGKFAGENGADLVSVANLQKPKGIFIFPSAVRVASWHVLRENFRKGLSKTIQSCSMKSLTFILAIHAWRTGPRDLICASNAC